MIKFTGTGANGQKTLFVALTDRNLGLMVAGKPVKLVGSEVGCDHDIYIFHGRTEQAIVDFLIAAGVQVPADKVHTHHDDDRQEGGTH